MRFEGYVEMCFRNCFRKGNLIIIKFKICFLTSGEPWDNSRHRSRQIKKRFFTIHSIYEIILINNEILCYILVWKQ